MGRYSGGRSQECSTSQASTSEQDAVHYPDKNHAFMISLHCSIQTNKYFLKCHSSKPWAERNEWTSNQPSSPSTDCNFEHWWSPSRNNECIPIPLAVEELRPSVPPFCTAPVDWMLSVAATECPRTCKYIPLYILDEYEMKYREIA